MVTLGIWLYFLLIPRISADQCESGTRTVVTLAFSIDVPNQSSRAFTRNSNLEIDVSRTLASASYDPSELRLRCGRCICVFEREVRIHTQRQINAYSRSITGIPQIFISIFIISCDLSHHLVTKHVVFENYKWSP